MSWYRRYGRWVWFLAVILVCGFEAVRAGLYWLTVTPVALAVLFVAAGYILGHSSQFVRDERLHLASTKALGTGFIVMLLVAIGAATLSIPYAIYISLDAGALTFFLASLYYRYL